MYLVVSDGGKKEFITYGSYKIYGTSGMLLHHNQFVLGFGTSNQAEYIALQKALEFCLKNDIKEVVVFIDSNLVLNQLRGEWEINYDHLRSERDGLLELVNQFDYIEIKKVSHKLIKGLLGH